MPSFVAFPLSLKPALKHTHARMWEGSKGLPLFFLTRKMIWAVYDNANEIISYFFMHILTIFRSANRECEWFKLCKYEYCSAWARKQQQLGTGAIKVIMKCKYTIKSMCFPHNLVERISRKPLAQFESVGLRNKNEKKKIFCARRRGDAPLFCHT